MPSPAASLVPEVSPVERLDAFFDELSELTGQRNAIDGRIVEIVREIVRATRGLHAHHLIHWEDGWSARITIGPIIAASSPSPDPPRISSSPTNVVDP
jgi:hypothetical protein